MIASLSQTTQRQQPIEHSSGTVLFVLFNVSVTGVSIDNAIVLFRNRAVSIVFVSMWTSPYTFALI